MPATRHDAAVPEAGATAVSCYLCPSCHRGPLEIGEDTAASLVPATCLECGALTGLRHDETAVGPAHLYTGGWHTDNEYNDRDEAAARVHDSNGGDFLPEYDEVP